MPSGSTGELESYNAVCYNPSMPSPKYPALKKFLGTEQYIRIVAMALNKKVVLDQDSLWLKPYLEDLNFTQLMTLEDLGLPQNATDDEIALKLHRQPLKTPNSAYLLLTSNEADFLKRITANYDVLIVPQLSTSKETTRRSLAAGIKSAIQNFPKLPQGTVQKFVRNPSQYNADWDVHILKKETRKTFPGANPKRK